MEIWFRADRVTNLDVITFFSYSALLFRYSALYGIHRYGSQSKDSPKGGGGGVRCSRKIHRLAILLTMAAGKIANKRPPPYFSAGIVNYKNCNNKQQSDTFVFMVELDEILIWCNLFKSFEWISLLQMLTVATSKCHNFFVYARRTF